MLIFNTAFQANRFGPAAAIGVVLLTLLLIFSTIALVTPYPVLLWLVSAPSFERLLMAALWFSMIFGSYNGAMVVFLTEVMPVSVRVSGFSFAYSLATGIFGGLTPAMSTYLIHLTGNRAMPGLWLSFAGLMGLTATLVLTSRSFVRRTQQSGRAVNTVHELPVGQR